MAKPNPSHHNPCQEYARDLVHHSRMTQQQCADAIGISLPALKKYLNGTRKMSYPVQYTFEQLILTNEKGSLK